MFADRLRHHTALALRRGQVVGRRDFLRQISALGLAAGTLNWIDVISASADELRARGRACILLWMQGGPSQFETFSPLSGHANGGQTKPIATSVAGIQIAEHFPQCAKAMQDLAIVRSLTSKEGNHQRATYLLHHGYLPLGGVQFPNLGANVAQQIGDAAAELPSYVRIGNRVANAGGGGFLGVKYDPLILRTADRPPDNTELQNSVSRFQSRMNLLERLQSDFAQGPGGRIVADQEQLLQQASDMILSPRMEAFDLGREPSQVRQAYGGGNFASGCLLARRLVEHGVTCVEVVSNGWDTHQDNFERTAALAGQIDQPIAALVADLRQRGMLDKTLVVWLGEFGRTPRINARAGRDHSPKAFNALLAGGGVRGGQVVGRVSDDGAQVTERPVTVNDLFRTIYQTLGINPDHENISRVGRPIKLVDGGQVVQELLG
jgi:hypothetical protein